MDAGRLPNGLPWTRFELKNGLTAYVIEDASAPVFTYQTWFKVGSKDEKLDPRLQATGLAHLFEHMMFRGTAKHPDGQFDEILTRNGVSGENATTWLDRTNYFESLPADRLELVMQLESDRMANLVVDDKLLDTERGAVLGEYRMGLDDPDSVANDHLYATAFSQHPYRHTTIGTEEEIKRFSSEDARYFYKKYYAPNNAVLIVAGDVRPTEVRKLAEKYYGSYAAQEIVRHEARPEPEPTAERAHEFRHAQLAQPKLLVGYRVPGVRHPDFVKLWIAQSLLATGEGAVLQEAWVEAGLAVSVGGYLNPFRDPGLLILGADLQEGKSSDELIAVLDRELQKLAARIDPPALERARNQLLLGVYSQWEDNEELASFMGEFLMSGDDPFLGFELVAKLDHVTAEEVRDVMARYLIPARRTRISGLPSEEEAAE